MRLNLEFFSYPDSVRPVLAGIELTVRPGASVVVAGGSGSGKTTLGLILAGVLPGQHRGAMSGAIALDGMSVSYPAAQAARINHQSWSSLLGYAGQDATTQLSTVAPTVAEEIAFPLENAGMPREQMQVRVRETAAALGMTPLLEEDPALLSGGQQKLLVMAAAIAARPRFLVLDEPSAGLDLAARTAVAAAIAALRAGGMGILVLTQDLGAGGVEPGHVVLLDDGRAVFDGTLDQAMRAASDLALPVFGARGVKPAPVSLGALPVPPLPAMPVPATPLPATQSAGTPILEASGLRFSYGWRRPRPWRPTAPAAPTIDAVSLAVAPGETVAVTGANGSGKSTLLRLLTGLSWPQSGNVAIDGAPAGSRGPGRRADVVGALLQHPREQLFERTVRREAAAGLSGSRGQDEREVLVDTALGRCGLSDAGELHPYELSAAGQRLTALAALLVQAPRLVALDEPTVSLDRTGLELLAAAVGAEAERGAAVVMVTHDLDFAYRTCSRLLVLSEGRLVADGPFSDVLESHFSRGEAYGVAAPVTWRA
ncbi:energy-coupling factor transporter ATP-binding protein EcfA2 [Arthrobacter pascens]|uniref:ABC transporter ATP-binding protein n=1 Tax=Arthrobacter pascens TaxID=1677 RepID=UPI002791B636|nr:ATP-binding cassette domain-containing protein [Arthrobacter pascens]MDQ0679009.1 energy-coupling factor transporter ATP-binding protein EcfA2 [Arthrobacter pascens]